MMMVGDAGDPAFCADGGWAGNILPSGRVGLFGSSLSSVVMTGGLRGASRGGIHGLAFAISRFLAPAAASAGATGNSGGTHGAGGDFAISRSGAAFDAGSSGGTQGAGISPAPGRKMDGNPLFICPLSAGARAC